MRIALLFSFILGGLFSCGPEEYSWNQRMTLVVEAPDGFVAGSSIVEIDVTVFPDGEFMTNRTASFSHRGEAVAVEVAPGQWLFALLDQYPGILLHHAGGELFGDTQWRDYRAWIPQIPMTTEPMTLPRENWPRLVTFGDIADPVTVAAVDPDDLSATFGEGVRLVEVTLEVVREGATLGQTEQVLPWLLRYENQQLDGNRLTWADAEFPLANSLNRLDFWR